LLCLINGLRLSICDVLRNVVEQNMGERSATSEPHMLS